MYNRLLCLYKDELLSEDGLFSAVVKRWITESQKQQIIDSVKKKLGTMTVPIKKGEVYEKNLSI